MSIDKGRFQGERLREAREARGFTGSSLAEAVGVTSAAISQYENNHHVPSIAVLEKLADKLNVLTRLFLMPPRQQSNEVVFWRSRKSASDTQRAKPIRKQQWLMDVVDYLSQFIEFKDVDFPSFSIPNDPTEFGSGEIEEMAIRVREEWRVGNGPIGNLIALLENRGAIVTRTEVSADELDAFSVWRETDNRPYITIGSDKNSAARDLFGTAHELFHMLAHRRVEVREFNKAAVHKKLEQQAMRFAGALLLPADAFADDLYSISLEAFRDLKTKWKVSISAMIHRVSDLGIISEDQEKRLWINMSRRKWRSREPGDDEIEPDQPVMLKKAFDMLLDKGLVDPQRMELQLGIRIRDIESVVGLPQGYLREHDIGPLKFRLVQ